MRKMAARARRAGTPISHVALSSYAHNRVASIPTERTRLALANALDVDLPEVNAACVQSLATETTDPVLRQRAQAFLRLTADRSDAEVDQLLAVVAAALAAIDASHPPPPVGAAPST